MTQHIRIFAWDEVQPYRAHVWRDDQLVMWSLSHPDLSWPDVAIEPKPIQFIAPDDPTEPPPPPGMTYSRWNGSTPAPIGDPPPPGTPDRRNYVALANSIMPAGTIEYYRYKILVTDPKHTEPVRVQNRVVIEEAPDQWYDPDIGNEPQP
jgi:hypothetical protein